MKKYVTLVLRTALICTGGAVACKDLSGNQSLPLSIPEPSSYNTPAGLAQRVAGTRALFRAAYNDYVFASGLLSDELTKDGVLDQRDLSESLTNGDPSLVYSELQNVRVQTDLVARDLATYEPDSSAVARSEMYALQGYVEIYLADLFCSGVPLTRLTPDGRIDYEPGISTDSLYRHAGGLFDSALVLAKGKDSLITLARVGKGRILLALGSFDAAARVVSSVSDSSAYRLNILSNDFAGTLGGYGLLSGSDREGGKGLAYCSLQDPRTPCSTSQLASGTQFISIYIPARLNGNGQDSTRVTIAGGLEARLIESEALLHQNTSTGIAQWLHALNALRATIGLSSLDDPGVGLDEAARTRARVDTMFAERGMWLYLTGSRQGDLHRLIRQYGRTSNQVYPAGRYDGLSTVGVYGSSTDVPIPASERNNPLFNGCLARL